VLASRDNFIIVKKIRQNRIDISFTCKTSIPPEELLAKASRHLEAIHWGKVEVRGHILKCVDGRIYTTRGLLISFTISFILFLFLFVLQILLRPLSYPDWVLVGLILSLFIGPTLIYWFTRRKNWIEIDVSTPNRFVIKYEGVKALYEVERLANMFKNDG
jgi:hypothetical protein